MTSLIHEINSLGICVVTFFNKNKNSFSPAAAAELKSIIEDITKNKKVKGLLFLSGNKKFFCAGGDLKFYSSLPDKEPGIGANKKISEVLTLLSEIPLPTAVCVNGLCIGGGVELISCFDYVIAGNASLFSLWQRKIGLSYGWSGGGKLLRRLSSKNLNRKFIDASSLTSYEALSLNLVDKVVPDFKLKSTAESWLLRAGALPKQPLELCKNNMIENKEQLAFEELWLQEDHRQALNKFNKK